MAAPYSDGWASWAGSAGQGRIGTALTAFAGEPSMILELIAR